jgi:hypothetical protein
MPSKVLVKYKVVYLSLLHKYITFLLATWTGYHMDRLSHGPVTWKLTRHTCHSISLNSVNI